jgi:hypothetical protein
MKSFIQFIFISTSLSLVSITLKGQGRVKRSTTLLLNVRLVDTTPVTLDCGYYPFALGQKFEVLTNTASLKNRFVVIFNPCPELQKVGLLKKGVTYHISATKTKDKSSLIVNDYAQEKLPTFWAEEITLKSP